MKVPFCILAYWDPEVLHPMYSEFTSQCLAAFLQGCSFPALAAAASCAHRCFRLCPFTTAQDHDVSDLRWPLNSQSAVNGHKMTYSGTLLRLLGQLIGGSFRRARFQTDHPRHEYDISENKWTDISPESFNMQQHCAVFDSKNRRTSPTFGGASLQGCSTQSASRYR